MSIGEEEKQGNASEPIAVVGMSCRFSGEANSVEGFWEMLRHGRVGHGRVPSSRYEASGWHHPNHERQGAINHDSGFFLEEDPSRFDAPFFSITAKEAAGMDPVQRLLLEIAYEAFENGGVPMEDLVGSRTAVFSGCMTNDYELLSTSDIHDMPHNSATGNGRTMLANRLSWFFDLRGPSVMLDTACSSSLTAAHLACQALRAGECDKALITGASLILSPNFTQRLSYMHMLSKDGISHSFDAKANGYGRGEGVGAVLLKPLSAAIADNDVIRAVIRGTGTNQDGRTPGITMPSRKSQADLIRTVYGPNLSSMRETTYFEAHGTGTEIGDPTELSAIGDTFGALLTDTDEPLLVGSVKSNIGHTEGAAGVASIIKAVLCLENGMLVPNAGFEKINPRIHLDKWRMRLSDAAVPWPSNRPQRASINSFGFGGSNAHIVIESLSTHLGRSLAPVAREVEPTPHVVVFSTQDKPGLARLALKWISFLKAKIATGQDMSLRDISYSMSSRRSLLPFRSFAVASSLQGLCDALEQDLPLYPRASRTAPANLAFVFTGQGAQWAQMGIQLLQVPVFKESMARSQKILSSLNCPWNLVDELQADKAASNMSQPDRSQSICCALQIALVDLLASWGVHPKATIGHSSGEIGAAYAARFITHSDAIQIAYFRGVYSLQLSQSERKGAMMAVGLAASDAQKYLETVPPDSAVVACVNSPTSVTLSGDADIIEQLESQLKADGSFARRLQVHTAYHSPHMRVLADQYAKSLEGISPTSDPKSNVTMFSSVTKKQLHAEDITPEYWVSNMVSPVEFSAAVSQLARMTEAGKTRRRAVAVKWSAFLEIGPHEALKGPFNQTLQSLGAGGTLTALPYQSLVKRGTDALQTSLQAAGMLWSIGSTIDMEAVNSSLNLMTPKLQRNLPSYPWNHQSSFWHEPLASARLRQRKEPRHDLLGVPFDYQNDIEPRWRNFLRVSETPWLSDHVVAGSIVLPAAGMIAMVAEAARQLSDPKKLMEGIEFNDIAFKQGVVVPDNDRGLETVVHVSPHRGVPGWYQFGIFSLPDGASWIEHATGSFVMHYDDLGVPLDGKEWQRVVERVQNTQAIASSAEIEDVYNWLSQTGGVTLGPTFRSIADAAFCDDTRLLIKGVVQDTQSIMPYEKESQCFMHPTALDALLQAAVLSCSEALGNNNANIPIGVARLYLPTDLTLKQGDTFAIHTETHSQDGVSRSTSIASDPSWLQPHVVLQGIQLGRVPMSKKTTDQTGLGSGISRFSSLSWVEHLENPVWRTLAAESHHDALEQWIRRFCNIYGDARVLVIIAAEPDSSLLSRLQSFAPHVQQRPRLQELTFAHVGPDDISESDSANIQQLFPGSIMHHVTSINELTPEILGENLYDAVLVNQANAKTALDTSALLESLESVTEPDGWLAIRAHAGEMDPVDCIQRSQQWNARDTIHVGDYALAQRTATAAKVDSTVYLLTTSLDVVKTPLQAILEQELSALGVTASPISLEDMSDLSGKTVISLIEFNNSWVTEWSAESLSQFRSLLQAKCVLWVSPIPKEVENAHSAGGFGATTGILRTLRNEKPGIRLPQLQFNPADANGESGLAQSILQVLQLTLSGVSRRNVELEYRLVNGCLLVPRVKATELVDEGMHTMVHGPRPALSSLPEDSRALLFQVDSQDSRSGHWVEHSGFRAPLPEDQVEVELQLQTIRAPGTLSSSMPEAQISAFEAVGIVRELGSEIDGHLAIGDTVVLLAPSPGTMAGMSTRVRLPPSSMVRLPVNLSPTQAVTMPIAYTLAYASLFDAARLGPNSSVLIVGPVSQTLQALINCALDVSGIQLFVAVENATAVEKIASQFSISPDYIFTLNGGLDASVLSKTNQKGVTAVISCFGGWIGRAAARCLSLGGHYVDLSSKMGATTLPASFFSRSCTFTALNLNSMLQSDPEKVYSYFRRATAKRRPHHHFDPVSVSPVADWAGAEDHTRQTGARSVVDLQDTTPTLVVPPLPETVVLSAQHTFVLAGGLGTLGLALARSLVDIGARHIVILSRSGVVRDAHLPLIKSLSDDGCQVDIHSCDISSQTDLQAFASHAESQNWQIKGILQCATTLKDGMFDTMTFDDWTYGTKAKICGTLNLHQVFANADLDFFITLSSVASVIGNMGQTNYSAGNAFMDELMVWRQAQGLSGNSINIGLVPDANGVGDVAESPEERHSRYSHLEGTKIFTHEIQTLVQFILQRRARVPAQLIAGITDDLTQDGGAVWRYDRKFDHRICLVHEETGATSAQTSTLLKKSSSMEEAVQVATQAMQEYLAAAMATTADTIDTELPLSALGVDSLKATELQNWVVREMGAELSSFEFLGSQPLKMLSETIAGRSTYVTVD
ncbi:Acyl transferase/acyl hydrolase/lysophospholipase [Penicillium nucicola]|uniref:Acyl transferase/acyl hydrolase/lysophospholipase n=1 Tax=Penicillium nucicola TaxID=1850975 RepID=UPI00254509EF|nr:Acyl transferase/acyl hydrolase/lysophospholipase [Penicillium nucicola]KAJ5757120.1 Acyl transferase/acyl hydrolase/lysophospholipase [Penicillium nucicola]